MRMKGGDEDEDDDDDDERYARGGKRLSGRRILTKPLLKIGCVEAMRGAC